MTKRRMSLFSALLLASSALVPVRAQTQDNTVLPRPPVPFTGRLEPTVDNSTKVTPAPVKAPAGAPNIVLVLTDDVGFAASDAFGGPIPTPNLDRLASHGLKYNEFHTTAICSATRAALLTGRNHHAAATGDLVDIGTPYPGYTGVIPKSAATVARVLRDNGYSTAMFGKHHNTPNTERSAAGPFDHWPTGLGFDYFYGFIAGDTDQYSPTLFEDTAPVDGSHRPADYLLDRDLADHAIHWLHGQQAGAPDRPFFLYLATGSAHAPHQAPPDWIARFRGKFDQGWDRLREETLARQKAMGIVPASTDLAARPKEIPAWDSLSPEEKRIDARYMEVYAAMLSYEDAQFGRVIDEIQRMGLTDNTLVVFIEGDNGASGEGGPPGSTNELNSLQGAAPDTIEKTQHWLAQNLDILGTAKTYEIYPAGWAVALDTPFPYFKQIASHLGGVQNGLVISWPARIKDQGKVRTQYHHVIDIAPTLLDAAHVPEPAKVDGIEQQRVDGVSMAYSFNSPGVPSPRTTQYFEMLGNRGIYHDGWLANTTPRNMPWTLGMARPNSDVTSYDWELYDLKSDFSQAHNLAAQDPQRLKDMQALFDQEARRNNVYPIQDSAGSYRAMTNMAAMGPFRTHYVFWGPDISLPGIAAPPITFLPFTIDADIEIPQGGANGVIVAAGSRFGGWSFYLDKGKPVAYVAASQLPDQQFRIASDKALPQGPTKLRFAFTPTGKGGTVTISQDGTEIAHGDIPSRPGVLAGTSETFDIGRDTNTPVSDDYSNEGVFTGQIKRVEVAVTPPAQPMIPAAAPKPPAEPD